MKSRINKSVIIALVITVFLSLIIYIGYMIAPGKDPYSEKYEFNISSVQLIENIKKFKAENQGYMIPQIDLPDYYDSNSTVTRYYYIYIYYAKEDKILYMWVANDIENKSKSSLNFVGINDGLQLGNWKKINKDFTKDENARLKNQFEQRVLKKLKMPYVDKGNSMSLF